MSREKSFLIIFIFVALIGFFVAHDDNYEKIKTDRIKYAELAGIKIKVELALTQTQQEQGLSGRSELKENEGMLFVFDQPGKYYFWMKGMNFPIDIIWIGENKKIIYIKKNAEPDNYLETYGPDEEVKYVLETLAGFSDKNNLKEGDSVIFLY